MAVSYLIAELLKSVMSLECVAKANGIESIVNQIFSHTSNYINLFLVTTVLTICIIIGTLDPVVLLVSYWASVYILALVCLQLT